MSKVIIKEFQNNVFQFREDGYFNMTAAAKVFGKDLSNFTRSPDYIEYVAALKEFLNAYFGDCDRLFRDNPITSVSHL